MEDRKEEGGGGERGVGRDLIVSRTKKKAPPRYARSSGGWNRNDRAGKVSGLQILATPSYCARRAQPPPPQGNPLACLKNNSKRRAASRLLTLGRISDEQIIAREEGGTREYERFIDDERVIFVCTDLYLDRAPNGDHIEEGRIWENFGGRIFVESLLRSRLL